MLFGSEQRRCFGGKYHFHLQGQRLSKARNQQEIGDLLIAGFLLGLLFDPEK
jgi:hypothetical protein